MKQFYENLVPHQDDERRLDLDGHWSSDCGTFDYDTDMSMLAAARSFAKEQWSSQYFEDLQKYNAETTRNVQQGSNIFHVTMHFRAHQTHYEQLGQMKIDLSLEGSEVTRWDLASFRDHSYGKNITTRFLKSMLLYPHLSL